MVKVEDILKAVGGDSSLLKTPIIVPQTGNGDEAIRTVGKEEDVEENKEQPEEVKEKDEEPRIQEIIESDAKPQEQKNEERPKLVKKGFFKPVTTTPAPPENPNPRSKKYLTPYGDWEKFAKEIPEEKKKEQKQKEQSDKETASAAKEEGNKYFKRGLFREAAESYSVAIQHDPSNPIYLTNRAMAYIKLRKFKSCVQDCNTALQLDPKNAKAYERRGDARLAQESKADALADFKKAHELKPYKELLDKLQRLESEIKEETLKSTLEQRLKDAQENNTFSKFEVLKSSLKKLSEDKNSKKEMLEKILALEWDGKNYIIM